MNFRIAVIMMTLFLATCSSAKQEPADSHGVKEVILSENSPAPGGPYSQAVAAGGLVFLSGQTGVDPGTRKLGDGGVEAQAERALTNLGAVLKAAGLGYEPTG